MIGVGANPGLTDMDEEVRRFQFKVEAGAEYAVTQPVFDLRLLENFLERIEKAKCRIPVVAGIWPLVSVHNAEFMKNELRVSVPDSILERMARAQTPELARAEGVAIAREMLIAAKRMAQGAQISAPQGRYSSAVDVLEVLGGNQVPELAYAFRLARCAFARGRCADLVRLGKFLFATDIRSLKLPALELPGSLFRSMASKRLDSSRN